MLPEVVEQVSATANQSTASQASAEQSFADLLEQVALALEQQGSIGVEKLLQSHPQHADRLRDLLPAMAAMASWARDPNAAPSDEPAMPGTEPVGGVLGDFRIIREIGRGGMGVVYEAEQISMRRRVALKVLSFAALVQEKSLQRFRNEVRAAAALDHPHIVSVYSIGEERGVHFYAMQLIRGQTLAELIHGLQASDKGRGTRTEQTQSATSPSAFPLPPSTFDRARISTIADSRHAAERYRGAARLGIQAAEALQHAHDLGVLHRDIKPGNLMLDGEGKLYIADFGLARIEADAGLTMTGDILGTLRYMAPEQALAKRVVIDHRADIYSLGATLYELFALQPAFGETDRSELLKQIAFEEPRPLWKIDRRIPVELETIVLKAMSKDVASRFATARDLADDLRRFLENKPILAKPPSLIESGRKWIARHSALVAIAAAALAIVAIVCAVASWLTLNAFRSESQQRFAAEGNLQAARIAVDRMIARVSEDAKRVPQLTELQRALLEDALGFYQRFLNENPNRPELRHETAQAYARVGGIQSSLGKKYAAEKAFEQATVLLKELVEDYPAVELYRNSLIDVYWNRAESLKWTDMNQKRIELLSRRLTLIRSEARQNPKTPSLWYEVAKGEMDLGKALELSKRPLRGEAHFREAVRVLDQMQGQHPSLQIDPSIRSSCELWLGAGLTVLGNLDEAEYFLLSSLEIEREATAQDPDKSQIMLARVMDKLGDLKGAQGKYKEALKFKQDAMEIYEKCATDFPDNWDFRRLLGNLDFARANIHWKLGHREETLSAIRRAISYYDKIVKEAPESTHLAYGAGITRFEFAKYLHALGQESEAEVEYLHTQHIFEAALARSPDRIATKYAMAFFLATCPMSQFRDPPRAVELAREALDLQGVSPWLWETLGIALYHCQNWQAAENAFGESFEMRSQRPDSEDYFYRAVTAWHLNKREEAQRWYQAGLQKIPPHGIPEPWIRQLHNDAAELLGTASASGSKK